MPRQPTSDVVTSSGEYSADSPASIEQDAFQRKDFAKQVENLVLSRKSPESAVIAIYGAWGEGKTTVLNYIRSNLSESDAVIILPFNPWRFGSDEQLLLSFFSSLSGLLQENLKTKKEKVAAWIAEYGEFVIPSIELGWGAAKLPIGEGLSKVAAKFSTVKLEELKGRIEAVLREQRKRVVVVMDDIDRLENAEIHQVFKLIKLTANFQCVDYLLAFDDAIVSKALTERYGRGNERIGGDFLEKIVQVPLRLPPASTVALRKYCFAALTGVLNDLSIELTEKQVRAFAHIFMEGFEDALKTPRMALRYANAVRFGLAMISREVNVVDYMVLEALRFFYPEVYALIRDKGDQIIRQYRVDRFNERTGELFSGKLDVLSKDERNAVVSILQFLIPQLQAVFSNMHYGPEYLGEWSANRRLCSPDYFERYFRLVVSAEDISDAAIGGAIRAAGTDEVENLGEILRSLIGASNAEVFIRKMMSRTDDLGAAAAEGLCIALAGLGESFSDEGGMMDVSVSVKASWMIQRIIEKRVAKSRRKEIARRVVEEANPPYFAADILSSFRSSSDESGQKPLSESEVEQLVKKLALRIKNDFAETIPWESFPHSFMSLMRIWAVQRSRTETGAYLKRQLKKDRQTCFDFLLKSTGKSYPLDTGIPNPQDFEKNHLDALAMIVDPKVIATQVRKYVGTELDIADYYDARRFDWPERIAAQFLWVYTHGGRVAKSGGSGNVGQAANQDSL